MVLVMAGVVKDLLCSALLRSTLDSIPLLYSTLDSIPLLNSTRFSLVYMKCA